MFQILSVIYYCHNTNIIHRDLKSENILIKKTSNQMGNSFDFGTAKILNEDALEISLIKSS